MLLLGFITYCVFVYIYGLCYFKWVAPHKNERTNVERAALSRMRTHL